MMEEALKIITSWNINWKHFFFMSDYSKAEINAIEAVFPETVVYMGTGVGTMGERPQAWSFRC